MSSSTTTSTSVIQHFLLYLGTTQVHKAVALFTLACLGVGFGVGFSVATEQARTDSNDDYSRRLAIFSSWQMELTARFSTATSLAATLGSFAISHATAGANLSAPAVTRRFTYNDEAYQRLCRQIYVPGITALAMLPGGVLSNFYPPGVTPLGLDLISIPSYGQTFTKMLATGQPTMTGPSKLTTREAFGVVSWFPIYVTDNRTRENFWGAAFAGMEVDVLLEAMNISKLLVDHHLDYAVWFTTTADNGRATVMEHSGHLDEKTGKQNSNGNSAIVGETIDTIMRSGMRMELPIAEEGRSSYLAIYPRGGPVSDSMTTQIAVVIVIVVILITALLAFSIYFTIFVFFLYRHRHAPSDGELMFIAAVTLRGAQPIAERAPLEAVRMFTDFIAAVRAKAAQTGCYVVSEVGDRTVYLVSKNPRSVVSLAKSTVFDVAIQGNARAVDVEELQRNSNHNGGGNNNHHRGGSRKNNNGNNNNNRNTETEESASDVGTPGRQRSSSRPSYRKRRSTAQRSTSTNGATTHNGNRHATTNTNNNKIIVQSHMTTPTSQSLNGGGGGAGGSLSSFIGTAICRPSAAIHIATARSIYDSARDTYFFGNSAQIAKLCMALDGTRGGEVGWTSSMDETCAPQCRALQSSAISCHIVSEGNEVVLHVASLWKETGDERDNEDPSTAMAALNDAYIKKMTVIVNEGRQEAKDAKERRRRLQQQNGGGNSGGGGSHGENGGKGGSSKDDSNKSADATAVSRFATILHIAVLDDGKMPLDLVRRVVAEEKGTVVSGHENVIVVAFNLLTPGGHHQIRAADTVMKLRMAFANANNNNNGGNNNNNNAGAGGGATSSMMNGGGNNNYVGTPFVCSIHFGKVNALIIDGLVLCSGEAVNAGRALLNQAIALRALALSAAADSVNNATAAAAAANNSNNNNNSVQLMNQMMLLQTAIVHEVSSGLCLLLGVSELSSTYDCEAVDVSENASIHQILLASASSSVAAAARGLSLTPPSYTSATIAAINNSGLGSNNTNKMISNPQQTNNNKTAGGTGAGGYTSPYYSSGVESANGFNNNNNFFMMNMNMMKNNNNNNASPAGAGGNNATNNNNNSGRVVYRLSHKKTIGNTSNRKNNNANPVSKYGGGMDDEEWMYKLRDEEDESPFAPINAIFARIAAGDISEAVRLWGKLKTDFASASATASADNTSPAAAAEGYSSSNNNRNKKKNSDGMRFIHSDELLKQRQQQHGGNNNNNNNNSAAVITPSSASVLIPLMSSGVTHLAQASLDRYLMFFAAETIAADHHNNHQHRLPIPTLNNNNNNNNHLSNAMTNTFIITPPQKNTSSSNNNNNVSNNNAFPYTHHHTTTTTSTVDAPLPADAAITSTTVFTTTTTATDVPEAFTSPCEVTDE